MFAYIRRFFFFFLTNILILMTLSILLQIVAPRFGINPQSYMGTLLIYSVVFGFGGAFISLLMSKMMAKMMMGVQVIDPNTRDPELRFLVDRVHTMARQAGISKMPEVGIYNSPELNAFATGPSKNNALVAVSAGLLRTMNQDEVEGVLGHEVAHIANGDMVTMTLVQGVINAMVIFLARILASVVTSQMRSDNQRGGDNFFLRYGLIMLFEMVFSILGMFVVSYFSRAREFRADSGGAKFAGREKMIRGLRKLQSYYHPVRAANDEMFATMKIAGGSRNNLFLKLISTHPPIEERIRRLETGRI